MTDVHDLKKIQRGELLKTVLLAVAAAGGLMAAMTCPGLLQLVPRRLRRRYSIPSIRKTVHRLDAKGWIVLHQQLTGWKIVLTARGRAELLAYELGKKQIQKPRQWDGYWHMLIFDIPERKRALRDRVRRTLVALGFVRLQDSVWIYPYDCRMVLELLRTKHGVHHEALYVCARHVDHDRWLRKDFGLPQKK